MPAMIELEMDVPGGRGHRRHLRDGQQEATITCALLADARLARLAGRGAQVAGRQLVEGAALGRRPQFLGGGQLVLEGLLEDGGILGVLQALLFARLSGAQRGSSRCRIHDEL